MKYYCHWHKEVIELQYEQAREELAKIMHESGRKAVEQRKIYRSDLPVKPFAEWDDLDENTKEGRRMMADYLLANWDKVVELLTP
jgi:hypothetical protein